MFFASDNCGPAHPQVMQALFDANQGYAPAYGDDTLMDQVTDRIRAMFEAPQAAVYLVATGTAANALALSTLTRPWQRIYCSALAHIEIDECNAPEFFAGAAKLTLVGDSDKMSPGALETAIVNSFRGDVHSAQPGPVSITNVTERGHVYSIGEMRALTAIARSHDCPVHLDGARFSNAVVALGCTPAEMTWKSGIDVVCFGGTKNGCTGVEAVIFFDPKHAWEFELRRKRAAHLLSKHRYLSAQMLAYLTDDLWHRSATSANANAARLAAGLRTVPKAQFLADPQANMIFATLPRAAHQRLRKAGAMYELKGDLEGDINQAIGMRLVCDWSISEAHIDQFIRIAGDV